MALVNEMHARFWSRVNRTDTCWLWTGLISRDGYGSFTFGRGNYHWSRRWAYEQWHGPIPAGLQIDHLCRVRNCVNPAHLEAVTRKVNLIRGDSPVGLNHRKTRCKYGHPFDGFNTYVYAKGRACRACSRITNKHTKRRQRCQQLGTWYDPASLQAELVASGAAALQQQEQSHE